MKSLPLRISASLMQENAKSGVAAMMLGCDEASKQGLVVNNVKQLILKNVKVTGCDGESIVAAM